MTKKIKTLFDHIKSITQQPYDPNYWQNLTESDRKSFSPYMIHRFLSMNPDWIDVVNIFQRFSYNLKPELVYKLYASTIPKSRTFLKYIKGKNKSNFNKELIELISNHYQVSKKESISYLHIFFGNEGNKKELIELIRSYGYEEKEIKKLIKRK